MDRLEDAADSSALSFTLALLWSCDRLSSWLRLDCNEPTFACATATSLATVWTTRRTSSLILDSRFCFSDSISRIFGCRGPYWVRRSASCLPRSVSWPRMVAISGDETNCETSDERPERTRDETRP